MADAIRIAFGSGKPSKAEQVQKELGAYVFFYYRYVDYFKHTPSDLDDLIDGLIYIHLTGRES